MMFETLVLASDLWLLHTMKMSDKPDRWILRLARACELKPIDLFETMKAHTGDSFGIIDLVLWRACEQGEAPFLTIERNN